MCAQRNTVERMLTSICCHNRFGFFSLVWTLVRPAPRGRARSCYVAAKNLKLHRPLRRVAPERRRASARARVRVGPRARLAATSHGYDSRPAQDLVFFNKTGNWCGSAAAAIDFARFVILTEHVTRVRMVSFADSFFDLSAFHLSKI